MAGGSIDQDIYFALKSKDTNETKRLLSKACLDYGRNMINKWVNPRSHDGNGLLHDLVEKDNPEVLEHILESFGLDTTVKRSADGLTPLDLAKKLGKKNICSILKQAMDRDLRGVKSNESTQDEKEKSGNIAWVDLEFTSLVDGKIIEVAIIITDKNLKYIAQNEWVIHFEKRELDRLEDWHQQTFCDPSKGGNGLFSKAIESQYTKDQVEEELLAMLKIHCIEKRCPLAGNSVHVDKQALQKEMPRVHDYFTHRIIDVSSFQEIMRRWYPPLENRIRKRMACGTVPVKHRAMDDIERSIDFMKIFREQIPFIDEQDARSKYKKQHHRSNSASPRPLPNQHSFHQNDKYKSLYQDELRLIERLRVHESYTVTTLNLKGEDVTLFQNNPHLRDVYIHHSKSEKFLEKFSFDYRTFHGAGSDSSTKVVIDPKLSTVEYWGQRKLAIVEIEFLTKYTEGKGSVVIYAGAAPGIHVDYLSKLFPNVLFVLIDDRKFYIRPTKNIVILYEAFSDAVAQSIYDQYKPDLFICNVRFNPTRGSRLAPQDDMVNQSRWYEILRADRSLLYFRPPKESKTFEYLKGTFIIEPWCSRTSTECRLVVKKKADKKIYHLEQFHDEMKYHQNIARTMYYNHGLDDVATKGLDHCYDCQAEIFILEQYGRSIKKEKDMNKLKKIIEDMSEALSYALDDEKRKPFKSMRTLDIFTMNI